MARTEELVIGDVRFVVAESTMRDEHRRVVLQAGARAELQAQGDDLTPVDVDFRYIFVDLQVATRTVEGLPWPVDFATFESWPAERYVHYVVPWSNLVYTLNPHWLNAPDEGESSGESEKEDASVPA